MAEPNDTLDHTAPPRAVRVGDVVHVPLDRGASTGQCRPALVVRVWNAEMGTINAQLFADDINDHTDFADGRTLWLTSLRYAPPLPPGVGGITQYVARSWHFLDDAHPTAPTPSTVEATAGTEVTPVVTAEETEVPSAAESVDTPAS